MSESAPEQGNQLTQEEVQAAEQAEQQALNANQKEYLTRRVVVLRAQVIRLQTTLDEALLALNVLREQFADQLEPDHPVVSGDVVPPEQD